MPHLIEETIDAPELAAVDTREHWTVAKAYPSLDVGAETRVPTVAMAAIGEELFDVLRATATVNGYVVVSREADLEVVPADPALFGPNRVLVKASGEVAPG